MYSRRIDEVWHQFILFTHEYTSFCDRYFGALLHHYPSNAPGMDDKDAVSREEDIQAFRELRGHYERVFGVPLSGLWYDRRSVTLNRRVLLDVTIGPLVLEESAGQVTLKGEKGRALTVNSLARPALELILQTRSFYVRELPGGLSDEEKLGLVETLVAMHVLMLAP